MSDEGGLVAHETLRAAATWALSYLEQAEEAGDTPPPGLIHALRLALGSALPESAPGSEWDDTSGSPVG